MAETLARPTAFDPDKFRIATRAQWEAAAQAWDSWAPLLNRWLGGATDAMLDMARVGPGSRVLDIAAGAGEQTLAAARRVGSNGSVLATDISPAILQYALAAARSAGLENISTLELDGERHDSLPAASFDAAVSRVGLIYFPDQQRALKGIRQALREGVRFAAMVYSTPDRNAFFIPVGIIFPEAYIPGYPAWIWRMRPGGDMRLADELHRAVLENAVDLSADHLRPLREAARQHHTTVVCGMHEREGTGSRGTLFNSVVTIGPDGEIRNRHRKVMPTNPERMVWGQGDATGIRTVDSECGRLGAIICWESYMPLARYALYSQGIDLYIAPTYDSGDRWIASARHIAKEAGCWVVSSGVAIRGRDIRGAAPGLEALYPDPDEWVNAGDSVVVNPSGAIVAGPLHKEQGILYADIDMAQIDTARRTLDVVGHYARPDLFTLQVRAAPLASVELVVKPTAA